MSDGKIIDFEAALLNACGEAQRREILGEALLLAETFAPDGRARELLAMADTLAEAAGKDGPEGRHARRLAAALRTLANRPEALSEKIFQRKNNSGAAT